MALCGNESPCHRSREQQGDIRMLPRGLGMAWSYRVELLLGWASCALFRLASFRLVGPPPLLCHCRPDGGSREAHVPCWSSGSKSFFPLLFLQMLGLNEPSAPTSPVPICLAGENATGACQVWVERIYFFNLSSCIPSAYTLLPCFVN